MSSPATTGSLASKTASTILLSRRFWLVVAAIVIAILPMIFSDSYWRTNLIFCAVNVLLAIGLDFVLGYAGQLNLGQSAFCG
jgi:ABC-type branched-subunit amino acid transport system permease subunit